MRLTHLKLAGFKSFVDPTTLHIHGQRVGVVGPNGCGKSNVMESVRWVLGESSAKEMRGDSMDAVIFNGSGNRKPISRASVELVFDNSLGGAAGEWSQYAEISVKRIIERDKGSTYYINNAVVRRRDVADLFLGTGLGGRAYAIIGQNTINRIVEAKPEELRVFLEEAAGISKYKERRRETETRLRDTRENLVRVEDILRELDKIIARLQSQAEIAAQYHLLQATLALTKGQVWLLKKRDASALWEQAHHSVDNLVNALEAQMASLRGCESSLETARQLNFNAIEATNQTQANYYQINAEVSNLENQVKNTADARERLALQLHQLGTQLEKNNLQYTQANHMLQLSQSELQGAKDDFDSADLVIQNARNALPKQSQQFQAALTTLSASQTSLTNAEQSLRLEQANLGHIQRTSVETTSQLQRFQQNLASIQISPDEIIAEKNALRLQAEAEVVVLEKRTVEIHENELSHNLALKNSRDSHQAKQREANILEAEINSLAKIQQSMRTATNEATLNAWLKNAGLEGNPRIWQAIRIKKGWETALEAILGARLNAIANSEFIPHNRPAAALSLAFNAVVTDNKVGTFTKATQPTAMYSLVESVEHNYQAVLQDWLSNAYWADSNDDIVALSRKLHDGECLVNQHGDIYTRHSVTFFGAQSLMHGVLERQAQLENLQQQLPETQKNLQLSEGQLARLEQSLQTLRIEQQAHSSQLKAATQYAHQLNLTFQQLSQQQINAVQRQKALQADCILADDKLLTLSAELALKQQVVDDIAQSLLLLQAEKLTANTHKKTLELRLNEARNQLQEMEREYQEKNYYLKLKINNINELTSKINNLLEENSSLKLRSNELQDTLAATQMDALNANFEAALNLKQQQEQVLITARNNMTACEAALQQFERTRMQNEQQLHPLRDKLEASRLAEQESRLYFEQCQAELMASNINESALTEALDAMNSERLESKLKVTDLERKRNKLTQDIEALGAVNLAAIQELDTEQIRKNYLDSQSKDLSEASDTLEDAIRKIDRETRGRLQATFDEANRHFNELFMTLFGGGQARLELLGEEILDTGMQVFAQPPGKRNSTIHLLSGGEKALTALALVFALFRLNPAPFCLMDEVDAPLDDSNTERFCAMVKKMSEKTQFLYVSHNKITMEMAQQLIGVTMQESGVSRIVDVDMEAAVKMVEEQRVSA